MNPLAGPDGLTARQAPRGVVTWIFNVILGREYVALVTMHYWLDTQKRTSLS